MAKAFLHSSLRDINCSLIQWHLKQRHDMNVHTWMAGVIVKAIHDGDWFANTTD